MIADAARFKPYSVSYTFNVPDLDTSACAQGPLPRPIDQSVSYLINQSVNRRSQRNIATSVSSSMPVIRQAASTGRHLPAT